ncbi:hypothetical protein ACIBH1_38305 [Nonomuraea sp. NPDC050663]|uniref:hypothetical protein n=1 Tax=Nonomuraea sp. NPDC050663 TaxID=3364370 RepID=UPI00379A686C
MRFWIFPVTVVVALFAIWLLIFLDVPLSTLLSLALGFVSLAWLVGLLIIPWNLYFGALRAVGSMEESRRRGIEIDAHHEEEARRIARRMLRLAIGGHLLSAVVVGVISYFSGSQVGYYFAGFYLLSTLFRPAVAYFGHLRRRITSLSTSATHPRDDVLTMRESVQRHEQELKRMAEENGHLRDEIALLQGRVHDAERRVNGISQRFAETVNGMADNHEVITGLKAFIRLLRAEQ